MKCQSRSVVSDINVTPMVDVMLVLLIVFMVTAPMLIPGVDIEVPIVHSSSNSGSENIEVVVSVTKSGEVYMNDAQITLNDLKKSLKEKASSNPAALRIFLRGDRNTPYEKIVVVLSYLKEGGFKNIALVTENQTM